MRDLAPRQRIEDFIHSRGLILHNIEGQPTMFAGAVGESNIDLTLSTRGIRVTGWQVPVEASTSDHRLITYIIDDTRVSTALAEPAEKLSRFQNRGWTGTDTNRRYTLEWDR
ncbi:hypothetical protein EVAR_91237_1 [Eumeta japonica]|uniref:Endonuclease/exonuclease/phosphatase domain-containing protein n=1 Tax=Eumeta variegata TaxID=151549 RepID=A0A4C2A279_EUMVA|nr:hypothetical protein EVAR_91237_1 [Eumeta japonica]